MSSTELFVWNPVIYIIEMNNCFVGEACPQNSKLYFVLPGSQDHPSMCWFLFAPCYCKFKLGSIVNFLPTLAPLWTKGHLAVIGLLKMSHPTWGGGGGAGWWGVMFYWFSKHLPVSNSLFCVFCLLLRRKIIIIIITITVLTRCWFTVIIY